MDNDHKQIKGTVLPEGIRRTTRVVGIIAAIIGFFIFAGDALAGLIVAVIAYYIVFYLAKTIFWIKNGFNQ